MTLTFNPGVNPVYTFDVDLDHLVDSKTFIKPYVQKVARVLRAVRGLGTNWILNESQHEYCQSFFHEINGEAGEFLWSPIDPVASPLHRAPDVSDVVVAGAPASARTYHTRYTWFDPATSQETKPSPTVTLVVPSGRVLVVTVPIFPTGAPAFRVYVSTTLGQESAQGYSTVRTWQEPTSGLVTGTSLVPSKNTLRPALKWSLAAKHRYRKISANRWFWELLLGELHA